MNHWFRRELMGVFVGIAGLGLGCTTRETFIKSIPVSQRTTVEAESQSRADQEALRPSTVESLAQPRTVREPRPASGFNLTLSQAVRTALENNEVIRQNAVFLSPNSQLYSAGEQNASSYDIEIQEMGTNFGQRGVEAAWSDFAPLLTMSLTAGGAETVQNNGILSGGLPAGQVLDNDTSQFDLRLAQPLLSGGSLSLYNQWNYQYTNSPNRLFPSAYDGNLGFEFRQPLWAGAGYEYTEIAGPISTRNGIASGVSQGIRIALINQKIAAIDFDLAVRNLVRDTIDAYWSLFLAYQVYEAELEVATAAHDVWKELEANLDAVGAALVAQAEHTYLENRARTEDALGGIYEADTRLRRLMGLPLDGPLQRPSPLPVTEEIKPNWAAVLGDALVDRVELRRQKLLLHSLNLQLQAAKSLLNPRLDFVLSGQLNGFGDDLLRHNTSDGITQEGYASAASTLFQGKQTGWNAGLQFSSPLGYRGERAQIRQLELRVAKAQALLRTQELEIGHEIASTVQDIARRHLVLSTQEERRMAVVKQVRALFAEYRAGRADRNTVDMLLRARATLGQASVEYSRALVQYNMTLTELEYRTGRLLPGLSIILESSADAPPEKMPDVPPSPDEDLNEALPMPKPPMAKPVGKSARASRRRPNRIMTVGHTTPDDNSSSDHEPERSSEDSWKSPAKVPTQFNSAPPASDASSSPVESAWWGQLE